MSYWQEHAIEQRIKSSLTQTQFDVSLFRLCA